MRGIYNDRTGETDWVLDKPGEKHWFIGAPFIAACLGLTVGFLLGSFLFR